jgi:hypothetical protein
MLNAEGDFLLFLSDDDAIADDFIERALAAFKKSPNCVAFMGSPVDRYFETGIDIEPESVLHSVMRPQLEDGRQLALRYFSSTLADKVDLVDPGFGYVVKSSLYRDPTLQEIIWCGGYEVPQYLALLPHGLVAFDREAKFYWGRHEDQTNKVMNARIGMLRLYQSLARRERQLAVPLWRSRFGIELARELDLRLGRDSGFRSIRYLWKAHPSDVNVIWVVGRVLRNPRIIIDVARTDAREPIFWLLLPRACRIVAKRGVKKSIRILKRESVH